MKNGEKNIHEGHRERLLDLVMKVGLENVSEVQAVEFMLTFVFPRGDVNPLAHLLLEEFQDFSHILDAQPQDLMRVKGINTRSAKKICALREVFYKYTTGKMSKAYKITCKADIIDIVEDYLRFRNTENLVIFGISASNRITHVRRIDRGNVMQVGIPIMEITDFFSSARPVSLVVAHCHPYGRAIPSQEDDDAMKIIQNLCKTCGVQFIDAYIVGEDGVYSQCDKQMKRNYFDQNEYRSNS